MFHIRLTTQTLRGIYFLDLIYYLAIKLLVSNISSFKLGFYKLINTKTNN